jgi:dTDP-4-dehydrorhamnose 3,5-epimerase
MIKGVIVTELKKWEDDRGWLSELFRNDETDYRPVMSYISMTNPGISRGPHEHVHQSDNFIFAGPGEFDLYLWDRREGSETNGEQVTIRVGESNPCSVIVPPGVVHGYICTSDIPAFSINFPDKLYKGEGKAEDIDEIRWEDDEDSPYQIPKL